MKPLLEAITVTLLIQLLTVQGSYAQNNLYICSGVGGIKSF